MGFVRVKNYMAEFVEDCTCHEKAVQYLMKGIDIESKAEPFVEEAKHCIGLDYKKPYTRNCNKYYSPYRNYFNVNSNDRTWRTLTEIGYAEEYRDEFFRLTPAGIRWLQRVLNITIKEEER